MNENEFELIYNNKDDEDSILINTKAVTLKNV